MGGLSPIIVWTLGILGLFWLDRGPKRRVSKALWIPTAWLFLGSSRNVSEWLQRGPRSGGSDAYLEGSPLDRNVLTAILVLGIIVLFQRRRRIANLLRTNAWILLYFFYCALSVLWSDFPDVAFKRWFRAVGDVVMVLVVLSDPDWIAAFKRLLTRLSFVLVPLSILLIRYYPDLGRVYSKNGSPAWTGVTTDKNALGMLCLIFGLAAIFRIVTICQGEEGPHKTRPLIAQGLLISMTIYLLHAANSATALACFGLAGGLMVLTCLFRWARKPVILHVMVATVLAVAFSALFLGVGTGLVEDLGRNSTLTGRTTIWHYALLRVSNPLLGTGFESFWLGPRLLQVSRDIHQGVNEAHNGYIEVYLNLGWVGVALLAGIILSGYRRIIPAVRRQAQAGSLRLAYFITAVAYNFTEAGFKMMHPVWIVFLLAIAVVPKAPVLKRPKMSTQLAPIQSLPDPAAIADTRTAPERTSPDLVTPLTRFTDM
jgi:exopolysaccharide production protein ExoQ